METIVESFSEENLHFLANLRQPESTQASTNIERKNFIYVLYEAQK